jgi:hypothetical protein
MSYRGTVKNGVVVLDSGAAFAEGTTVRVEPEPASPTEVIRPEDDPFLRILDLAGPTGIPDLSINADHYLYGHTKVTDGR